MLPLYDKLARQNRDRYKRVILEDGATFYAPLDETYGTSIVDRANGAVGTLNGGTLSYTGCPAERGSKAVYFANTAGHNITFPTSTNIHPTGSFTLECWAYMLDTNPHEFICKGTQEFNGAGSGTDFELGYVGGSTYLQFYTGSASISYSQSSPAINGWHHYIARFTSGSELVFFFDSVKQTAQNTVATAIEASTGNLKISGVTYRQNGYLAHCAIYHKPLSDGQCQNHYRIAVGAA